VRATHELGPYHALRAIRLRTCKSHVIALAVEADDEHGASVAIARWLVWSQHRRVSAFRRCVTDTFTEATMAEFVGAAEKFNGIVGAVGSQYGFHGAVMLVAKGQDVRPHAK
jgi:hypothetical protein